MTSSPNKLTDETVAELNPTGPEPDYGPQADPIPDRPAAGAAKDAWVDYVVALGADRTYVTTTTEHYDDASRAVVEEPGLSRDELAELADRLGG